MIPLFQVSRRVYHCEPRLRSSPPTSEASFVCGVAASATPRPAEPPDDQWATADWAASWRRGKVDETEWAALRARLKWTAKEYLAGLSTPRELPEIERNGMIGGVVHLAYHLGAIRQIDRSIRGPSAED